MIASTASRQSAAGAGWLADVGGGGGGGGGDARAASATNCEIVARDMNTIIQV